MYGIQDKINQILRGAETIRKNQSMQPLQPVNSTTTFFAGEEPQTPDNEVARLREENENLRGTLKSFVLVSPIEAERMEKMEQDYARLRELCEWAETLLCNSSHQKHCAEWEWNKIVKNWRDQFHGLAPAPEEPETSAQIDKCIGNVTEPTIEGVTMEEWYGGFSKIESTEPANPTCSNTTHKFSHCDCKEPVSLDHAPKITHEGNTDAKFKQLHEVASIIVEYIEDPDRRSYYRSQIQQLTPTTEETSKKDTSTETCPSQKDTEWRELGPDEVIQEGDEVQPKHHDKTKGEWKKAWSFELGVKAGHFKAMRFRTRRPLPNPSESPKSSKEEEMPLEKELVYVEKRDWSIDPIPTLVVCIRYLRDEIQKLK